MKKRFRILSIPGLLIILSFALNVGLRFGRGIDYNIYGINYDIVVSGEEEVTSIGYMFIRSLFVELGLPYQSMIFLFSIIYIIGVLFLMKPYKNIMMFGLPLFVFFSLGAVENMIRWYLAFSFFLIGIPNIIDDESGNKKIFIVFSVVSCLVHYAFLPIPLIFYYLRKVRKPFLAPLWSMGLFFAIGLFFETSFMLQFTNIFKVLTLVSKKFEMYGNNADYYLTSGYRGNDTVAFPGAQVILLLLLITFWGYRLVQKEGSKYVFVYNLFLIGLLLRPIAYQIELVERYDQVFFFFRAIVLALIFKSISDKIKNKVRLHPIKVLATIFLFFYFSMNIIIYPFRRDTRECLYIWNKGGQTYDSQLQFYYDNPDK